MIRRETSVTSRPQNYRKKRNSTRLCYALLVDRTTQLVLAPKTPGQSFFIKIQAALDSFELNGWILETLVPTFRIPSRCPNDSGEPNLHRAFACSSARYEMPKRQPGGSLMSFGAVFSLPACPDPTTPSFQ